MKNLYIVLLIALVSFSGNSQTSIQISRTYGGYADDSGGDIKQLPDGGFLLCGRTASFGAGNEDIYVVRTDTDGNTLWTKTYGGTGTEQMRGANNNSVIILDDGSIIILGVTTSYGAGSWDYWLIKTNSLGDTIWTQTYGGSNQDLAMSLTQTNDGGFALIGLTYGFGSYANDVYFVKVDQNGVLEYENTFPIQVYESGIDIIQTEDNGFLITGVYYYPQTAFLLKLDANYHQESIINLTSGTAYDIDRLNDGGFIICGFNNTESFLTKTDEIGHIIWHKEIVGAGANITYNVEQQNDGNFICSGETNGVNGSWDYYFYKTDANGDTLWTQTLSENGNQWAQALSLTNDGGFALLGYTNSQGNGMADFWFLKIKEIKQPAYIKGKIFVDDNDNCTYDISIDGLMVNRIVKAEPGPYYTFTDRNGDFSFELEPNTYAVSLPTIPNEYYDFHECQTETTYTVELKSGEQLTNVNFNTKPLGNNCSADITIISAPFAQGACTPPLTLSSPCPGSVHRYCFTVTNTGNGNLNNGQIQIDLDPNMTFVSEFSNSCATNNTINLESVAGDNPIIWDINNNAGFQQTGDQCTVCFEVMVDIAPFPIGTPYSTTADLDACGNTYIDVAEDYDVCSCDPNDKLVSPKGCGVYGNIKRGESLKYHIRFQNVGTGATHNVVIRDTIDADFDLSSFNIQHTSHTITAIQINSYNELVVSFNGIELPDSPSNPEGSKGEIIFELMPLDNLPNGTELINTAGIYFDSNPPVITNTTLNTVRDNPYPIVDFTVERECISIEQIYNFTYTGNTSDNATYYWDFGIDATPQFSTDENPVNIVFNSNGIKEVDLTIASYGCTNNLSQTIDVPFVRCGNNNKKILVCHTPDGNPNNAHTICIAESALQAHLDEGSCIGSCITIHNKSTKIDNNNSNKIDYVLSEQFVAYPNPINNFTTLSFVLLKDSDVSLVLYNSIGQKIQTLFNNTVNAEQQYKVVFNTEELPKGIYIGVLKSNNNIQTIKLIK